MKRQFENDEGASLILVVIFVMVFAVVIGAVLDFAGAGFKTTEEVVQIRNQQHAVDGAMDGAINSLRRTGFGTDAEPCPEEYTYDATTQGDPKVVVKCTVELMTGEGEASDEVPEYAILTGNWRDDPVSVPDEPCKGFIQTGNEIMSVRGGIFSNNRIAINEYESGSGCGALSGTGRMVVAWGNAFAFGKCTWWTTVARPEPKITSFLGNRACFGNTPAETGAPEVEEGVPDYDPNYDTAAAVAAASGVTAAAGAGYDPLPECTSSNAVTFHPGVYTEIPTYHYQRKGCSGDVWYFEPGTYYFDFPADDNVWNVNPYNIIGGTLAGGRTITDIANSWSTTSNRHYCDEDPYTNAAGVQFIFGGPSRIATRSNAVQTQGVIDLCGGKSPTLYGAATNPMNQRLVVYGLRPAMGSLSTQGNRESATSGSFQNGTDPTSPVGEFLFPERAKSPDGASASKQFIAPTTSAASIAFDAFNDIPLGATVTGISAKVRHAESNGSLKPELTLRYESGGGAAGAGTTLKLGTNDCAVTGTVTGDDGVLSIEECDIGFLQDPFLWREVNSLSATYTIPDPKLKCTGKPGEEVCPTATAFVDSVVIEVAYQKPGFEAQTTAAQPFLATTNNPIALFEGTFYAPYSDLSVNVHNAGTTEFARGVIANHIQGQASASSKQITAPFRLPDPVLQPIVILEARVGDKPRLRARVAFEAGDGLFGRFVHIRDWVYIRD